MVLWLAPEGILGTLARLFRRLDPRTAAAGNFDVAAVFAGESVGLIHDIPPAAEIVDRIVTEAGQILSRTRNSSAA